MSLLALLSGPLPVRAQEIPQNIINQPCTACTPTDVHTVDVDADGDPDVLSASAGDNKIAWYENLDSGGFSEQKTITPSATNASSVYAADVDGDGDPDVLATHNTGDDEETQVAWYENLDSGGFSSENPLDTGGNQNASSVFATDIDNDNDADVVVGFDSINDDEVAWHENLDNGGLSASKTVADGFDGSKSVYATNLDGDGDKDIISASADDQIEWYENLDDGGFSSANPLNSNFLDPTGVYAADFDGDTDQDIIGVASAALDNIVWFENLDSSGFSDANTIAGTSSEPQDVHVADFDDDGDSDVTIANSFSDDITWYENLDSGGFSNKKLASSNAKTAMAVTAADVDNDNAPDLLSASQFEDKIAWHQNQLGGSGGFSSGTALNVIPDAIRPTAVHTAALDDDGDQDVLYATFGDKFSIGKIAWHENIDGGGFSDQNTISTEVPGARSVVASDLDGDNDQDILFGSASSAGIGWFENLDAGGFSTQNSITSSVSSRNVVAADLDGDQDEDVLFVSGDKVQWLENLDDGGFESSLNVNTLTDGLIEARSVAAADIGSDGDLDVIGIGVGGYNDSGTQESGKLVWFENEGSGSFSSGTTIDGDTDNGQSVSVADFDGDGDKGILAGGGFGTETAWYENLDDGGFSAKTQIAGTATSVRPDDVNGDGAPDVLLAGGARVAWTANLGGGTFGEPDTISTKVQDARSIFSANLDDDSDPDVLSASFNDDKVSWYENTEALRSGGQSLSAPATLSATVTDAPAADLTWNAVEDTVSRYRVYRDTKTITGSAGDMTPVDSVAAPDTSLTDTAAAGDTYYYRVTAVDTAGTESGFSNEARAFLYPSEVTAAVDRSFEDASDSTDYRLVALPGQASRPLADAIGGDAGTDWQAYWDDGSASNFLVRYDGSDTFTFKAGNGFWLTATDGWTNSSSVSTVELRGDSAAKIPLRDGWNVVSNPIDKDVAWSRVQAQTPDTLQVPFGFNGTFSQADTFRSATSGVAYYFLNDASDRDSLVIPYPGAPGTDASSSSKARSESPSLLVLAARPANAAETSASRVNLGLSETARSALGPEDLVAPPGRFAETNLRIEAPGAPSSKRTRFLMTERRPSGPEGGQTFTLRLKHRTDGPVQLSVSNLKALEGRSVALLNPADGTSHDLRADGPVEIDPNGETTELKVAIGSKDYVDGKTEAVRPETVRLSSYPNPVRQQGTVAYALPERTEVTLQVYDVLGRRVATLASGQKEAGRHTVSLQTDRLSSGVYFGRLQAGGQTRTQKITVVR